MTRSDPLVLCCGSRSWRELFRIKRTLYQLMLAAGFFKVLHGGARGADSGSGAMAQILGLAVDVMPADWARHGKRAGFIRNAAMLDRQPDYVVAFWDGVSRGTLDTINKAVNVYRIPTIIVRESE